MNCDVCGHDLRDENGLAVAAIDVKLLGAAPEKERVKEIFAKTKFRICYVCYLKSLGIKTISVGQPKDPIEMVAG